MSITNRAIKEANRLTEPLPLVFLNSVEFINALNTRVFRNEITVRVRNAALAKFEEYLGQGVFRLLTISAAVRTGRIQDRG